MRQGHFCQQHILTVLLYVEAETALGDLPLTVTTCNISWTRTHLNNFTLRLPELFQLVYQTVLETM